MAKTSTKADDAVTLPANLNDLYAGFSAEEVAELLGVSGQSGMMGMDKTPVIKVNYCDLVDKDGNEIRKGNFVLGQNSKEIRSDTGDICIEYIGKDLGKNPLITVLAFGTKYSYYNDDAKLRCSSQLVFDRFAEKPVGTNLKHVCSDGSCPRRAKDVDKKEKCASQFIVFCEVGEDKEKAIMYVKGASYMPFNDYVKSAGTIPLFFCPTKLNTTMEKQGAVTYYIVKPELLVDQPFPQLERKTNFETAKQTKQAAEAFKAQQAQNTKAQLAGPTEGRFAKNAEDMAFEEDDNIVF